MLAVVAALEAGVGQRRGGVRGSVRTAGQVDVSCAAASLPPLTTIRQPLGRIGAGMVRLLAGDSHAAVILPTDLVVRGSA